MKVYQAIQEVSRQMSMQGISKSRKNATQGYSFRGIDEVLNALSPALAHNGLVVIPRMLSRELTERQSAKGGTLFSVVVDAEFDFISTEDGSKHTAKTYGEAMDSADKATNKAMSAAYKYAAFLTFCIPLEGMAEDADSVTPEVQAAPKKTWDEAGYNKWLSSLARTTSDGYDALLAAVAKGPQEFKDALRVDKKAWAGLKGACKPVAVPA